MHIAVIVDPCIWRVKYESNGTINPKLRFSYGIIIVTSEVSIGVI